MNKGTKKTVPIVSRQEGKNLKNRTIKSICILLIMTMFVGIAGFAQAEPDYYHIGLEVTSVMSEMVDSETYLSLLGTPSTWNDVREAVNTGDYDKPVAVYAVTLDTPEAYLKIMIDKDPDSSSQWNSLSDNLQEQILNKIGVTTICSIVNGQAGASSVSFANLAQAYIKNSDLTEEKKVSYLYLFEKGTPILVTFGYHAATGMFVFIPAESQGSVESLKTVLPFVEITLVEIEN